MKEYLSEAKTNNKTQVLITSLLHLKGKIFNVKSSFTWAEFYYCTASLFGSTDKHNESKIACSAAIELLVLATDILDDLADQDFNGEILTKLSVPQAVSLSSLLLMEGLHIITLHKNSHLLINVIEQLREAAQGQTKDLSFCISRNHLPTEKEYFAQISRKSVSLTRLVFHLNASSEELPFWNNVADCIGFSGQISNDARDLFDDTKNDLIDKKATLPLIKAIEAGQSKNDDWLLKILTTKNLRENRDLLPAIRAYVQKTGAIKYCEILTEVYLNKAIKLLKKKQEASSNKIQYTNLIRFLGDDDH
ncbi:class 1 isoprenoid biosynthesis enzyme [Sporolactobacillus shoreicorticis]|uniref:Polyprenyl synthetase family protein n=1 Tax=Sporolactobacillus shoreicorticis TaxID=1923877 RepID=A0ABW5S281_9BACL|nr:class 1 isoprenoid biosynthesis enzyme [Sporolactobacillus shoreicorticis]MCO7125841.1 class 1 isoprenoid biosynthesis enzyme [Sporolactobacillus shoreicorticis]